MKPILSFLAVAFFFFSVQSHAQKYSSNSLDEVTHFQNNQMFETFVFKKFMVTENNGDSKLDRFSKDLRSELSSQKWNTILNGNDPISTNGILMIKVIDKDKINLFGNPLMGFTEKKLVFDESALFSDTILVYSF
ncbi:hypothetical protein [Flavobacterium sp. KBS0721]|uniref:hypothetical protein n=1 Tax=Flavobacterium sp. KBS0721 TaxID=1179672 RepID=UPI00099013D6|nr:hypothetical protein [Flavobacterium sp. KBS0721]QDW22136.1 hypothetical protein B0M43_0019125 [Flavobacterium sp. KBS0721]